MLLYIDIGRRRGLGRRRKSWARAHGFDYEQESTEIVDRWKRGVMSTVGDVTARNVVLGQVRGEAVYVFDLEDVATVVALHRKVGTEIVMDLRLSRASKSLAKTTCGCSVPSALACCTPTTSTPPVAPADRRMVTFAHTAPGAPRSCGTEQNWTLVAMPIASTRAQWDEGLRCRTAVQRPAARAASHSGPGRPVRGSPIRRTGPPSSLQSSGTAPGLQ